MVAHLPADNNSLDDDESYPVIANPDLERSLIGALFLDQHALDRLDFLAPSDFYGGQHAEIFRRMRAVWTAGAELTPYNVAGDDHLLFMVCSEAISAPHATSRFINSFSRQIKDLSQKRTYERLGLDVIGMAQNGKTPGQIGDHLMEKVAALQADGADNPFDRWAEQGITAAAAAACAPVERQYVVDDLLREKSLSIFYGAPGALKSGLVMDLAVCVANGLPWLQPLPVEGNTQRAFATRQTPVLWLNYDQSHDDVIERLGALARTYGGGEQVTAISHSAPAAILETERQARNLGEYCKKAQVRVIVVDSLLDVKGAHDLQEAGMGDVLRMWRLVAEVSGAAVIMISHSTKLTQDLYGSQFLKAKLDHLYRVTRPAGTDTVIVESEKQRSYGETGKLYARWTYQHQDGTRTLDTAQFWGDSTEQRTAHPNNTTQAAALAVLMDTPGRTFKAKDITIILNTKREEEEAVSVKAVAHALDRLAKAGEIGRIQVGDGPKDPFLYHYGERIDD